MAAFDPKYRGAVAQSAYLGSVHYYAALMQAQSVAIDGSMTGIPALWAHNHCRLSGANGIQQLVIPVDRANYNSRTPMRDIVVSNHGDWRHLHWGAMFSAYGKSPFFEYVADDLERIIKGDQKYLLDLNNELHQMVIDFLDLPIAVAPEDCVADADLDLRRAVGERRPDRLDLADTEYYQLWASRHGFMPNLSILDLLCNTGREAVFTLLDMAKHT